MGGGVVCAKSFNRPHPPPPPQQKFLDPPLYKTVLVFKLVHYRLILADSAYGLVDYYIVIRRGQTSLILASEHILNS